MIVAIQQPEHLPWIGFFNKMAQCDLFVYLDNVQFKKRYFENRNKVNAKDGIKWLTVPVFTKGKYTQNINEVIVNNELDWKKKYTGLLEYAYKKSNYWIDIKNIVFPCLDVNTEKLIDLNLALVERCRNYLQIETPTLLASTLDVDQFSGSDLIFEICLKTGADIYISGPDGRNYLQCDNFFNMGMSIIYHGFIHPAYPQIYGDFTSHLSILDLIANCGPDSRSIVKNCYIQNINDGK
jgi:hypothetical protein